MSSITSDWELLHYAIYILYIYYSTNLWHITAHKLLATTKRVRFHFQLAKQSLSSFGGRTYKWNILNIIISFIIITIIYIITLNMIIIIIINANIIYIFIIYINIICIIIIFCILINIMIIYIIIICIFIIYHLHYYLWYIIFIHIMIIYVYIHYFY